MRAHAVHPVSGRRSYRTIHTEVTTMYIYNDLTLLDPQSIAAWVCRCLWPYDDTTDPWSSCLYIYIYRPIHLYSPHSGRNI